MLIHSSVSYQNLNSGSLLINGLNSSSDFVGNVGPSSSSSVKNLETVKIVKSYSFVVNFNFITYHNLVLKQGLFLALERR